MTNEHIQNDTPVEVYGYKTDPLRRGYQILWNYESIYWRALVGSDAWALYEVLRSFCHDKNPTCNPSINLLLAILAFEDRRVLTGRTKQVKEKEYRYPGLVDILQTHGLAIAEVKGEGPEMRYIFHVNLTPGLLTTEQLAKLPAVLQQKHKELLQRCEQDKRKLEDKKRPSKLQNEDKEGVGISQRGVWEIPRGGEGNSHPNNTHVTLPTEQEEKKNNNSGGGDQDVVVALTELGITRTIAQRLARRHKESRIFQKIDFINFELAKGTKIKNVAGRLRRMIEDDWAAPAGYTPDWRDRQTAAKQELQARQEAIEARQAQQQEEDHQRQETARQKRQEALQAYQSPPELTQLWQQIVTQIEARSHDLRSKLLADCLLVKFENDTATIWTPNQFIQDQIERQYNQIIKRLLAKELQTDRNDLALEWLPSP